jgi:hypothetical protein
MSESMAIIVRGSNNKLMLEVKDSLSQGSLQLLTHTRSGHFQGTRMCITGSTSSKKFPMLIAIFHHRNVSTSVKTPTYKSISD